MARRILITRRDYAQAPDVVFSGGLWAQPLTNLQDINPQFVAETYNPDVSSTQFVLDLGTQKTVGLFHLQNIRTTSSGMIRLRAGTDVTFAATTYDSGLGPSWPMDSEAFGNTVWGDFTLTGVYYSEEYVALGMPRYFIPPVPIAVRYIKVEIIDTTAEQPLRIGCFGACEVWEPPYNLSYGWRPGLIDGSEVMRVPGGSTYITHNRMRRTIDFGFKFLAETVFKSQSFGLGLIKGRSAPLVVVPFPDDTASLEKLSVYGLFSKDPEFANPFFRQYEHTFRIEQLV